MQVLRIQTKRMHRLPKNFRSVSYLLKKWKVNPGRRLKIKNCLIWNTGLILKYSEVIP